MTRIVSPERESRWSALHVVYVQLCAELNDAADRDDLFVMTRVAKKMEAIRQELRECTT